MPTPSGLPTKTDFQNATLDLRHLSEVVNSRNSAGQPIDTSVSRLGVTHKTLDALETEYTEAIRNAGGAPLGDGTWQAGETFTAYNQFMVYNGVAYKPLTTTTLPYGPTGATPDLAFVGPYTDNVYRGEWQVGVSQAIAGDIWGYQGSEWRALVNTSNAPVEGGDWRNLSEPDDSYIKSIPLAEAVSLDGIVGTRYIITDRKNAEYMVQPVGLVANGFDIVGLPSGKSLEYVRGTSTYAEHIGAVGDDVYDNTDVLNRAVDIFETTRLGVGVFAVGSAVRKRGPNPISREIEGDSQWGTVIKALPTLTNSVLVWFGNSTGYGSQYVHVRNLTIDGTDPTQNCTGLLYQSCGLSSAKNITFRNLGRTFWGLGCIDTHLIDCDHFNYTEGPHWTVYPQGETGGDLDDLNNQQTQTTNANTSSMVRNWVSNGISRATYISGAQFRLKGCVYQSATNDNTKTTDMITIENSNEAYGYGAGPIVEDCWVEGGEYRFSCAVLNTRQSRFSKNIFNGAFNNVDQLFEGGLYLDANSVENSVVKENSFRGYFNSAPTQGRTANGCLYLQNSNTNYTADVRDNYITYNTTNVYWEGMNNPAVDRSPLNMFATISGLQTTPSVDFASSNFISSVVINGTGDITINYSFNRQALPDGGFYPVMVTCHTSGGTVTYPAGHLISNAGSDRFIFNDDSGNPATPVGITIHLLGGGWV